MTIHWIILKTRLKVICSYLLHPTILISACNLIHASGNVQKKKRNSCEVKHLIITGTFMVACNINCNYYYISYITYYHSYCACRYVLNLPPPVR